ncbi:MAG: sugar nucleotide-binding protein [Verrucomicrobiales bacterium]|nr:sugar nucleotide-binding protein [Verrucomicrobiales bacterium]
MERLDLSESLEGWSPPPASAAILCAALTRLEDCRRDPSSTRHINVTQTLRLAEKLRAAGVFVVFPSSNLVFAGHRPCQPADDPLCPQTEYGRQKAAVEAELATFGSGAAIVRLTKVVGPQWALACDWAQALRTGRPIRAFNDLRCAPIPLELTVHGLLEVAHRRLPGIWQFSAPTDVSYAELASHLARRLGADPSLVKVVSGQATGGLEHIPCHTTLDTTRARAELGIEFPAPFEAMARLACL